MSEAVRRGSSNDGSYVGDAGEYEEPPECLADSLERLEDASEALSNAERELEAKLKQSIAGTLVTGVLCIGPESRIACVNALIQHVVRLDELGALSEDYDRLSLEYEAALARHLTCLDELAEE